MIEKTKKNIVDSIMKCFVDLLLAVMNSYRIIGLVIEKYFMLPNLWPRNLKKDTVLINL